MRLGRTRGHRWREGGYSAEADAGVLLTGWESRRRLHERKMSELQGGQKVPRPIGASAGFGNPSGAASGRATNNLDLDSVHWLKEYLSSITAS